MEAEKIQGDKEEIKKRGQIRINKGARKKSKFLERFGATRTRPIVNQEDEENQDFFNR